MRFDKILVTTDFSEGSRAAFDFASYQAKMEGSKITLVHVMEELISPVFFHEFDFTGVDTLAIQKKYELDVKDKLDGYASKYFHKQDVKTELLARVGTNSETICDYAKKNGFSLICLSAYGRGGLHLLGSTAERILRNAPCPVLIIPRKTK